MEINFKYNIGDKVYAVDKDAMKKFESSYGKIDGIIETIHTRKYVVEKQEWCSAKGKTYRLADIDGKGFNWTSYSEEELSDDVEGLANSYLKILLDKFSELSETKKQKLTTFIYSFLLHFK